MRKISILLATLNFCMIVGLVDLAMAKPRGCSIINGRIEVSVSGSCNSIQEAINIAPGTAENPVVIDVLPGIYKYSSPISFTYKDYIHLRGTGPGITTIELDSSCSNSSCFVLLLDNRRGITISGLTIKGGLYGINILYANSPRIINNLITGSSIAGIQIADGPGTIIGNTISGNSGDGIDLWSAKATIRGNIISGNTGDGISNQGSLDASSIITENTIKGNGMHGIEVLAGAPAIIHNLITENGSGDVNITSSNPKSISFNVYDTINNSR